VATLAPEALRWLGAEWAAAIDTAVCSGIVGDQRHVATGGYHVSREDLRAAGMAGDYSIAQFAADLVGPPNLAAAIDMTMSPGAMRLVTGRLAAAWRVGDQRLAHVRGFNGTLDSRSARRWDRCNPNPDDTDDATDDHLWHVHLEVHRAWADDMDTARAILAVVTGTRGDDMAGEDADRLSNTPYRGDESWPNPQSYFVKAVQHPLAQLLDATTRLQQSVDALTALLRQGGGSPEAAAVLAELRTDRQATAAGLQAQLDALQHAG